MLRHSFISPLFDPFHSVLYDLFIPLNSRPVIDTVLYAVWQALHPHDFSFVSWAYT